LSINAQQLASMIDHTLLKANATQDDIRRLCTEAREYGFYAVCVNPCFVKLAAQELKDTPVKIISVVGFPLGANTIPVKVLESKQAALDGAHEVDIVLNIGALLEGDTIYLANEIDKVIEAARDVRIDISAKVILETGYLTRDQMLLGCWVATGAGAGADYVKNATGYGPTGASVEEIRFLRQSFSEQLGVKAAGGIKDLATALAMVEAGADRLGTSSGVQIIDELKRQA